jgi:hypothetical protein
MDELGGNGSQNRAPDRAEHTDRPDPQAPSEPREQQAVRGHQRAETLTRAQHADTVRADRSPGNPDAADGRSPPQQADQDRHRAASPDARDHAGPARAEMRTRAEYASIMHDRPEAARVPDARPADAAVTHFHGEFKDQRLDLYTDGTRWASSDSPPREKTIAREDDQPDRILTGKELADGADSNDLSRADRIRSKLYEESEDALDALEKNANLGHDIFASPPTGSYEGTPTPQPHIYESHPAGIDAGTAATALFTLGLVIDRAAHSAVEYYKQHRKEDSHAGN